MEYKNENQKSFNPFAAANSPTEQNNTQQADHSEGKRKPPPNYDKEVMDFASGLKFLRDPLKKYHAVFVDNGQERIIPVESKEFIAVLSQVIYQKYERLPSKKQLEAAINLISFQIGNKAEDREFIKRIAGNKDALYIDMCTNPPLFLRLDHKTGAKEYVLNSPFIPRRFDNMRELPKLKTSPKYQFSSFLVGMGITDRLDILLILTFIVSKMFYRIQTPYLWFTGKPSSGKSTLAKCLKDILDPTIAISHMPSKKADVAQLFDHQFFPVVDNISAFSKEYSDLFCGMYTGMDLLKREEFSVDKDHSYVIRNTAIMTSVKTKNISEDLLDRVFFLKRKKFDGSGSEINLSDLFYSKHAYILDETTDLYLKVYGMLQGYTIRTKDRSNDFVAIGRIIAQIIFNDENIFEEVVSRNIMYRDTVKMNSNEAVAATIEYLMDKPSLTCRISDFIHMLDKFNGKVKGYPDNPATFSRYLNEGIDLLADKGISFTSSSHTKKNNQAGVFYTFINNNFIEHSDDLRQDSDLSEFFPEIEYDSDSCENDERETLLPM